MTNAGAGELEADVAVAQGGVQQVQQGGGGRRGWRHWREGEQNEDEDAWDARSHQRAGVSRRV